jgi:type IV pilus assembly protein PilM
MSVWRRLGHLLKDPPPEYAFELSEEGIAWARCGSHPEIGFQPLEPGVVSVSPLRDNVLQSDALTAQARRIAPGNGNRKTRRVALILPDYAARVSVLDFDSFPSDHAERLSLVRFRIKKTVPFDVESAAISFQPQTVVNGGKRVEVVAAVVALEVVARYEAAFRSAGFQPGVVTVSSLAALSLAPADGMTVLVRIGGRALTVCVLNRGQLKLLRCVELTQVDMDEVMGVLYPTFAYIEDELKGKPERLLACGFGGLGAELAARTEAELGLTPAPLRSRFGTPGRDNAGLLGYLEAVED